MENSVTNLVKTIKAIAYQELNKQANIQLEIVIKQNVDFSQKSNIFEYQSPETRFVDMETPYTYDEFQLTDSDLSYKKITRDVIAMCSFINDISRELQKSYSHKNLVSHVANIWTKQCDNYKILNSTTETQYKALCRDISDIKEKLKNYKWTIYYLKPTYFNEVTDIITRILCETGYMSRWMKAQLEIQNVFSKRQFAELINKKTSGEKLQIQEGRINAEIMNCYHDSIESLQESIGNWDSKRDADEAALLRKTHEIRVKRAEINTKISALQQLYDKHKREIDDYLQYKELKQQELEEQRLKEIEIEEMNLLKIENKKLKEQELLRKKYLSKEKKKKRKKA